MKYRRFGRLDWQVSALGFGIMRLPHREGEHSEILEEEAGAMVRHAVNNGVNYLDTAYNYHGGLSEVFLGKLLKDGLREKVRLATKLPCWKVKKTDDLNRYFDEQLERLQTDRVDFYLLHSLQDDWWDRMKEAGYLDWAEKQLADGRIGHLGFSFHDKLPLFRKIIDDYDNWTMTMVMYNYMDVDHQAGTEGVKYAADRGLAVVVMEPLRGGLLARVPPDSVKRVFDRSGIRRTPADWSLQWLWDRPEVSCAVSGMSTMEQLRQNLESAGRSGIGSMSEAEKRVLAEVRKEYRSKRSIPCTDCRYCLPCPEGVAIPWIFSYYNMSEMYEAPEAASKQYGFLKEEERADRCTECGRCMEKCPQHIDIIERLKEAHRHLS